jgi:hypothetical protein
MTSLTIYRILTQASIGCLFVVAVMLVATLPCKAQSATYSDMWYVDQSGGYYDSSDDTYVIPDNPSNPIGYVAACGVTSEYSNMYGHQYWVVTNLSSPSGRTASMTSSHNSYSSRADVQLSITPSSSGVGFEDPGDYNVTSQHWIYCPYMGGSGYPMGSSFASINLSIRYESYLLSSAGTFSCTYSLDCPEGHTCGYNTVKFLKTPSIPCGGPYVQSASLLINGIHCFNNATMVFTPVPGFCT